MAQLKAKDGTMKSEPTCFASDSASGGFVFHLRGGVRMFAQHSFLMRIDIRDGNEICFYYTYGVVRVIGRKLDMIYHLALSHALGSIQLTASDDPCRGEIEVTQIIFEEAILASNSDLE